MYEIALSVGACMRSNTRADVAWLISDNPLADSLISDALAFTPGGGKIGKLLSGSFDGFLSEIASRKLSSGRILEHEVTALESTLTGLPVNTHLKFVLMPAQLLEPEIWPALLEREAIAVVCHIDDDDVVKSEVFTSATILAAEPDVIEIFNKGKSAVATLGERVVSIFYPVTKLAIAGSGPIADALEQAAKGLGWQTFSDPRPGMFAGFSVGLSKLDCAVIMGHDVESSSQCLAYALESSAGYIGALGSKKMQENREDWLAYREITDISRVHGPAGFNIGALTPGEIAISILAEAIATLKGI